MKAPALETGEGALEDWAEVQTGGMVSFAFMTVPLLLIFLFSPIFPIQLSALFLFFILAGSKVYSIYLVRTIRLRRLDSELRGFRNEWLPVELAVENRGRLPAFMLRLVDAPGTMPVYRDNRMLCTLGASSRVFFTWNCFCTSRGIFTLGPATIYGADPLGIFPFQLKARARAKLFVYPSACFASIKTPGGIPLGTLASGNPLYEDITRSRSLRPYQSGDELRRINWKASARGLSFDSENRLIINEYEPSLSYPMVLFLNLDPSEYSLKYRELYLERVIEAAASLCLLADRERQELGLVLYSAPSAEGLNFIKPGPLNLIPILECLAGFERFKGPETANGEAESENLNTRGSVKSMLEAGKTLPFGTRLIYTGPNLDDEAYMNLHSLKKQRLSLEYLVIDEHSLPGRVPGNSRLYQIKEYGYEIV